MKHLQTFENFTSEERNNYHNILSKKEELVNSSAFKEMTENEQEILSDAYDEASSEIQSGIDERIDILTKHSTLDKLFG